MKDRYIKYESLSNDIKKEIEVFHQSKSKNSGDQKIENTMLEWFEEKFDEWLIVRFKKTDDDSRRKHFRLDVEIPIKIVETLIDSSYDDDHVLELVGQVVNISRGGLYFRYNHEIEISSIIKVIIDLSTLDDALDNIEALAMVIRVDKIDEDDYGIGIMFSSIYESNKEDLNIFILKNLSNYMYSED